MNNKTKLIKRSNWFLNKPIIVGGLVFLFFSFIISTIAYQRFHILKEKERDDMAKALEGIKENIEQSLRNSYTAALTLALTIDNNGNPENFELVSDKLTRSNPSFQAVQLMPNGVVKYIYPLKGNEAALNFDVLHAPEALRKEARSAVEERKMHFAGPLKLQQGGIGVIARLPIFRRNKFWGFSAVVIKLDTLLKHAGILNKQDNDYYYQFSKVNAISNKEEFFLSDSVDFSKQMHQSISFPEGNWKLYLISKNEVFWGVERLYPLSLLFGLFLALVCAILIAKLLKKPAELQERINKQAVKLFNSEIRFKAIFDHAAVGIAHVDSRSGKILETNFKCAEMLGYSQEELSQKTFMDISHPDDLETSLKIQEKLVNGSTSELTMQQRLLSKNHQMIWVNLTISALWDIGEKPSTHITILEDVSAKKEAENIILTSEERFRNLFNDSPVALWEEDFSEAKRYLSELGLVGQPDSFVEDYLVKHPKDLEKCIQLVKITDVSNQCLVLHSAKSKEELLAGLVDILTEESMHALIMQLIAITSNKTKCVVESKVKTLDGRDRYIYLKWNVMPGYEDNLGRVIVATEDISVIKESEKAVALSQQKIESLINTVDGIVWEADASTFMFTFVSKRAEEILGYPVHCWINSPTFWVEHIYAEDREWAVNFCAQSTKEGKEHDFEYRMIAQDGSIVWLRDIVNVIFEDGAPKSLRGIMIDITASKQAELDLNNSFRLVNEQNQRLMNFSYIVSHNLRSHTSNIQSIANLIELANSNEEREELINLLKTVSETLNETMHNLNEVVNIQTDVNLSKEPLNLREYIDTTIEVLQDQLALKNAIVYNNVPNDIIVKYNPAYLESVLLNFISNAIRYSHPERKPVVSLDCLEINKETVLSISDNGIGIDLNKNGSKLFGMYKTFTSNPESRGIGLFMSKNQIEAMGGSIDVESELNKGTTFKIHFV